MSNDHDRYRDGWGGWAPFYAAGEISGSSSASTLQGSAVRRTQPIGFRGAAPGQSFDDRGLPRIRVKAVQGKTR
jgi:hypothetical protein